MAGYTGSKEDYLKRLRRIEGQVRGISRMVEEDVYCIDILTQISAATGAGGGAPHAAHPGAQLRGAARVVRDDATQVRSVAGQHHESSGARPGVPGELEVGVI